MADLITRLTKLGAVAIAFDVIFAEPDRLSPALAADVFRDLDEETRNKLRALPSNDQVMADAMQAVAGGARRDRLADRSCRSRMPSRRPSGVATLGGDPKPFLFNFPGLSAKHPGARQCRGRTRAVQHPHRARRHRAARADGHAGARQRSCLSLTFEMLRVVTGSSTILIRMDQAGIKSVAVPGFEMPTDRNGQLWVHFAPHDPARYVSAVDVLEGRVPAGPCFPAGLS